MREDHTLTVRQVNQMLSWKKITVAPMIWSERKRRQGKEYKTEVNLKVDGSIIPSFRLIANYTSLPPPLSPVFHFVLLSNNERIYAIDVEPPRKQHTNSEAGAGRPYYKKSVSNIHEHTWSAEGEGYAEPLILSGEPTHFDYWQYFSSKTNIEAKGGYRNPLDGPADQMSLLSLL